MNLPASASSGKRWWMRRLVGPPPNSSTRIAIGSRTRVTQTHVRPPGRCSNNRGWPVEGLNFQLRPGRGQDGRPGEPPRSSVQLPTSVTRVDLAPAARRRPATRPGPDAPSGSSSPTALSGSAMCPTSRSPGLDRRSPPPPSLSGSRVSSRSNDPPPLPMPGGQTPSRRKYSRFRRWAATTVAGVSFTIRNWSCSTTSQPR